MAKVYCVNCGEAVEGSFCGTCGTPVAAAGAAPAPAGADSTPTPIASTEAKPVYSAPAPAASPSAGNQRSLQTGRLGYKDAIKSYFANYLNFEGRASQSAYWYAALFVSILSIVANNIGGGGSALVAVNPITSLFTDNPLATLFSLATILPNLSVGIRRLHDTGRSGTYLLWALLPIVGWILLIVWLASPSDPADNKYGPRA